jgi:hypothetical protein
MEMFLLFLLSLTTAVNFAATVVMIRILGDLLKGWENTKYTWVVFVVFLLTVPAFVILTRLITLTQMCGN